jgi:hypothetical protein
MANTKDHVKEGIINSNEAANLGFSLPSEMLEAMQEVSSSIDRVINGQMDPLID